MDSRTHPEHEQIEWRPSVEDGIALLSEDKSCIEQKGDLYQTPGLFAELACRNRVVRSLWLIFMLGSMAVAFSAGWISNRRNATDWYESAWDEVVRNLQYEPQVFNPRFDGTLSQYMGDPSPEMDTKWYSLSKMHNHAVSYETLVRLNRTRAAVEYPGTGKYQATLMAYHQLHCLNYIRMYTNQSYYETFDFDMIAESPVERRTHKDHCIEMLRQHLMCSPDLNVYTYHWVSYGEYPEADLFTRHERCVNWDRLDAWVVQNSVYQPQPKKPVGAEVVI